MLDEHTEIPGEQVLLDENVEAEGHEFFSLGAASISPDGNVLAYSVDVVGDERYTLRFRDLRTGEQYPDEIVGIGAGATWGTDNRTVYYITVDAAWRPDTVWRHRLASGLPAEKVYHEADEKYWLGVGRTRSDKYVLIAAGSAITSEIRYADAADPEAEFVTVLPRRDGIEYSVEHAIVGGEDRFLILHNDNAVNFMLAEAPVDDPAAQRTLIEHRDDVRLDGVDAFAGHLVVSYRGEALPRIQLWPITEDGYGRPEEIAFDSELMSAGLGANPTWDSPKLRIGAGSFITPVRIYDLDLVTGERTLLREQPVLGDYRREDYVERRDWAQAADGTRSRSRSCTGPVSNSPLRHWYTATALTRSVRTPVLHSPALAARPRHGLRRRTRAWRRRDGPAVVRARQAAREEEHLHRFRGGRTASGGQRTDPPATVGGAGRKRRRPAHGCGGQHGARPLRRHPGAGAIRRSADHDPGPVAAVDRHRVGRVGKPVERQRRLPLHEIVFALRERRRTELSGHSGDDVAARHPGLLRRACQMGCCTAPYQGRR